MRWTLLAAGAAIAATLWLPGEAAQPADPAAAATAPAATARAAPRATDEPITFEKYRDWRLNFIERRRGELAAELSAAQLPAWQKSRLEQSKSYYDWFAGLSEGERDRRFRERFERIDANRDGQIDTAERTAWRDKQRDLYRRDSALRPRPAAAN